MVLSSLRMGLLVLDRQLCVTSWNRASQEAWGLREEEGLGKDFFSLDIGLETTRLREPLLQVLQGKSEHEVLDLAATNRRGRPVQCRIQVTPLEADADGVAGEIVLIEALNSGGS
jgi:two-component system CheB/CheR fusion protein